MSVLFVNCRDRTLWAVGSSLSGSVRNYAIQVSPVLLPLHVSLSYVSVPSMFVISIVDPRHGELLAAALGQVITNDEDTTKVEGGDNPTTMVELRVTCGGVTFSASMSMRIEPHKGLVIVTRLYPVEDVHGI